MKTRLQKALITVPMAFVLVLSLALPTFAAAPEKANPFICPTVSLNNSNGMWVLGDHGAYYVIVPTKGKQLDEMGMPLKVFVSVPERTMNQAQIPAGKALFKDYPSYPNFVSQGMGTIMLLEEGLAWLPGAPSNWGEGDMLKIEDNLDGTYTVINNGNMMDMPMAPKGEITIESPIPLNSAVFW
ncbi:MAG: hypothetical protein KAH14_07385 [Clostridiales bacterium]|nr:hypothetical protein [Clostridiales bacterium]